MKTSHRHPNPRPSHRLLLLAALAVVALSGATSPPAVAQSDGTITGVVTNSTTGKPVADLDVTLSQFTSPTSDSVDTTVTTDATGRYTFSNVDTADGFVYATSV